MLRSCSRCGRIHSDNFKCNYGIKRKYQATDENKLRGKGSWKLKRQSIKERSFYLCAVCRDQGDYSPKALEVHHIKKLREDPDGLLEDDNLVCLCIYHHKQADRGELDADYLKELAKKRDLSIDTLL